MPDVPANARPFIVRELPIELSKFVKFSGLAGSGGEAKHLVSEGRVLVNGTVETKKGRKLAAGDRVTVNDQTLLVQPA